MNRRVASVVVVLALAIPAAGCAPSLHRLSVRTPDGHVQTTTPRARPALSVTAEQFPKAVLVLARRVTPASDPLDAARKRFGSPIRTGSYAFRPRTKELRALDDATAAREFVPPELLEQANEYLRWCQGRHQPGDCLGALHHSRILDGDGRYAVAMGIAISSTLEETKASLREMVDPAAVTAMVLSGITMYLLLWTIPEPVSKGVAAVMTVVLVGYFGVETLYTLGHGFKALVDRADGATTFDELQRAGEDYSKVLGADAARILVMVATAAIGGELGSGTGALTEVAPTLPGAARASELAVAEGGIGFEALGQVSEVTISESGLTIATASGATAVTTLMAHAGGPGTSSRPAKAAMGARAAPVEKTVPGERFVRVGAGPPNLKWTMEHPGGVAPGTYAIPESVFNEIGPDPARLKDFLDLPGEPPRVFRILEPAPGTPIQRGIVPGGEFGGRGGVPEVYFPEGF